MKSILSLVVALCAFTAAHATQATLTAYQSSLANNEDVVKAIAKENKATLPVLWSMTFDLNEAKETKATSDFSTTHVTVKIDDLKRTANSDKISLRCRVDESVDQQTTPPNTNSFQTNVVVKVGGSPVILGRTTASTKTNSQESVSGRVYVLTLK